MPSVKMQARGARGKARSIMHRVLLLASQSRRSWVELGFSPRHLSSQLPKKPADASANGSDAAQSSGSAWWTNLRAALFPISSGTAQAAPAPAAKANVHDSVSPATMRRLQRAKDAAERQQQQTQASSTDVFIPLSRDAELFSGNLFKVGMLLISLPLAGWFLSKTLLVALCIKGLRSGTPDVVKISLSRVRTFIFNDYLASRFEQDDGVVMLVSLLGHANMLSDEGVMSECLEAIMHLMKFEETRTALLLGMVIERLQRALDRGWVAKGTVAEARRVMQALETMKQEQLEAAFGRAPGAAVADTPR